MVLMLGTGYRQPRWSKAWSDEVARFREHLAGTKTRLGLHYLVAESQKKEVDGILPGMLAEKDLDEIEFYEEMHMAYDPVKYPAVGKAVKASKRVVLGPGVE